jgi:ABC-type branched-subunit amino acid transport system ATPase component
MRELISYSSAERESTQRVTQKRRHFQPLLDIFEQGAVEHLQENRDLDLARSMVASPQILAWNETTCEGVEEKNKITELTVAFKFISYT